MTSDHGTLALEVRGLSKSYNGFCLDSVTFDLPVGFTLGLIGPNGAGKTTTIKLILGAIRADAGSVRIYGRNPWQDASVVRSAVGFVHESPPLFDHLTVADYARLNGLFYRLWDWERFRTLADRFELPLRKRTGSLSRGMKMKLTLAIALSHDARLLILDEPTSGLDPVFRRELLNELREYLEDGTRSLLFSTHITGDLEHMADYILYLRSGSIGFSSSVEEFRDSWRTVRGSHDQLTDELKSALESVRIEPYGFVGLSRDSVALSRLRLNGIGIERATFDDIVVLLEEDQHG